MPHAVLHASWPRVIAVLAALAALAALTGCGDDRTATSAGTLYHCATTSDCLAGYVCTCNFCQLPGKQVGCDAGQDATADAADLTDTADSVQPPDTTVDAGPIACNLLDWTPCPAGQGCYYDDPPAGGSCAPHGNLTLDAGCDPTKKQCGLGTLNGTSRLLRCDTVDKKCYPTCDCMQPALYPCRAAEQCYCLQDPQGKNWPDDAGICAPKP